MADKETEFRVVIAPDGPYIVSGNIPLSKQTIGANDAGDSLEWIEGEKFSTPPTYALCRCGESKKKPFCDGAHAKVGFDGAETASREPFFATATVFDGPALQLADVRSLCADGRFCDPNGKVWNQAARTDDPEIRATFLRQVDFCPAGRLVALDKAAGEAIERPLPISIGLVEDPVAQCSGPIWLRGGVPVVAADGFAYETRNRVTLCRCGQSKNKPFCDGAHVTVKFRGD